MVMRRSKDGEEREKEIKMQVKNNVRHVGDELTC